MGLRDIIDQIVGRTTSAAPSATVRFEPVDDSDGMNFVVVEGTIDELVSGTASSEALAQFVALQMLEEEGLATRQPFGFALDSASVTRCDDSLAEVLDLPGRFASDLDIEFDANTTSRRFHARLQTLVRGREVVPTARGGILHVGGERFRATPAQWDAFEAITAHQQLPEARRDESTNVQLVGRLLRATQEDPALHAGYFERRGWSVSEPSRVGVRGEFTDEGDLVLAPVLDASVQNDELDRRWGQLGAGDRHGVLRVDNNIISLDEHTMDGVREILQNRTVPAAQVEQFLKTPSAFLDAALVDLDLGFSVRVEGIGVVRHIDFDTSGASAVDWFQDSAVVSPPAILRQLLRSPEDIEMFEAALDAAQVHGATAVDFAERTIDISDPEEVTAQVTAARAALAEPQPSASTAERRTEATAKVSLILNTAEQLVAELQQKADLAVESAPFDGRGLARTPFPHQATGIEWITGLALAAAEEDHENLYRLQGAVLADDMGLGKTFMALAAIAQFNAVRRESHGPKKVRPTLVVAPLTLLENWEAEVAKSFDSSPFTDIVVLQSARDLSRFTRQGHGRETTQLASLVGEDSKIQADQVRLSLRVGSAAGADRLDVPGRLVLTTYDTLRDYQLSMAQVDWGIVVFDEAQAIKNPNTGRTRAAKGLRATFKLVTTGTPVENSLGDFWCLVDTAQPGLLGDWAAFREQWITPVLEADEVDRHAIRARLGKELRDAVGIFMLRRIKEDHLPGLPDKFIHSPFTGHAAEPQSANLAQIMPDVQRTTYDAILRNRISDPALPENHTLVVLTKLRAACVHPELGVHGARPALPQSPADATAQILSSGKLRGLFTALGAVRDSGEKAIIFAMSKDLQLLLALWVRFSYGIQPSIINGDTAAMSKGSKPSRRRLIEEFESVDGFNVIIMSPIAAGTGLTVIGANHVFHVERHWNPAKEAQATDRAYRIGQTRDVHVYYPASIHPSHDSFDALIDRLLANKVTIKDAVMEQNEFSESELSAAFGLTA